LITLKNLK